MHQFIAIGDTVIDAFIRLQKATVTSTDPQHSVLSMPFADKIPYEERYILPAVGNAPNAAVSAARLGLSSALVSNLGEDQDGKDCLASLKKDGVDTSFIQIHEGKKTNYHYALWFEQDRTILIKHEEYPYTLPEIGSPSWLYFSSVSETAFPFHLQTADYLEAHPEIKLAFQPGKNELKLGYEKLSRLYKRADILFCNIEEAEVILGVDTLGTPELLKRTQALGPRIVVITDGPRGAYAYDGAEMWFVPVFPDGLNAVERTGAGDAFASTTVIALIKGKDLPTALMWGAANSASVVQKVGAQEGLLTEADIEAHLAIASSNFAPKKVA